MAAINFFKWPKLYVKKLTIMLIQFQMGTFWLKIEQFWPFEEISIFSNGGHLGYRTVLTESKYFGLRYIGDHFFLGPNLVSFNRAVVPYEISRDLIN
jgi:hypothetical protein